MWFPPSAIDPCSRRRSRRTSSDVPVRPSSTKACLGTQRARISDRALAAQLRMMDDTGSSWLAVMGNFPEVLVTTPANAARLVKMGYEVMK